MIKNFICGIAVVVMIVTTVRLNRIDNVSQFIKCLNQYVDDNTLYTPEIWLCYMTNY